MFRKKCIQIVLLCVSCLFFACTQKNEEPLKSVEHEKIKRVLQKRLLFVLGQDYGERPAILQFLQTEYETADGQVQILTYADLTKQSRQPRTKMILDAIREQKSEVVISLGVPEASGKYLLAAKREEPSVTVISLLAAEEILPIQAASDLVIDFQLSENSLEHEQEVSVSDSELAQLLMAALVFAEEKKDGSSLQSPLLQFADSLATVSALLNEKGKNTTLYRLVNYIDPDTGLTARNHVLLDEEQIAEEQPKDMLMEKAINEAEKEP
ncbi:hypothetical protein [Treponema phagedenis]|uniref:hypothetical protein n=1 Tax=Treponema phagedenis TaxID=162 RepID=UPI0001F63819|nr:hypothetical protein [Treponema phagedenis]EFW36755.1 hypothetical protein HMPREF9554_02757 [Treponema phagedenis F0421]TYT78576.1 hypothetical protein FS559_05290 [Treponema phagedenis]